jgi:hypothetical protein
MTVKQHLGRTAYHVGLAADDIVARRYAGMDRRLLQNAGADRAVELILSPKTVTM